MPSYLCRPVFNLILGPWGGPKRIAWFCALLLLAHFDLWLDPRDVMGLKMSSSQIKDKTQLSKQNLLISLFFLFHIYWWLEWKIRLPNFEIATGRFGLKIVLTKLSRTLVQMRQKTRSNWNTQLKPQIHIELGKTRANTS